MTRDSASMKPVNSSLWLALRHREVPVDVGLQEVLPSGPSPLMAPVGPPASPARFWLCLYFVASRAEVPPIPSRASKIARQTDLPSANQQAPPVRRPSSPSSALHEGAAGAPGPDPDQPLHLEDPQRLDGRWSGSLRWTTMSRSGGSEVPWLTLAQDALAQVVGEHVGGLRDLHRRQPHWAFGGRCVAGSGSQPVPPSREVFMFFGHTQGTIFLLEVGPGRKFSVEWNLSPRAGRLPGGLPRLAVGRGGTGRGAAVARRR